MEYFVPPETAILRLADGAALTVRRRLTAGDVRRRLARGSIRQDDGSYQADALLWSVATVTAYLLDWTITDPQGAAVPIRGLAPADLEAVLDNLDPDVYRAIRTAIETHEAAMIAERAEQKKTAGSRTSPETLPSLAAVAGGTNG